METCSTSSAVGDGSASNCAPQALISFTPSVIRNLLLNCGQSSCQGSFMAPKVQEQRLDLSVEELLQLGSAVMKEIPLFPAAILPHLKPMIQDCFSLAISRLIYKVIKKKRMLSESLSMPNQGPASPHEVDHINQTATTTDSDYYESEAEFTSLDGSLLKTEVVIESGEDELGIKCEPASDSAAAAGASPADSSTEDDGEIDSGPFFITLPPGESLASHSHNNITKNVPPHILYNLRGVRCKICWRVFRRTDAVDVLVKHIEEQHPEKATVHYLRMVRRQNAFDKVIGKGIPYCTCEYCKIFGLARFHKRFWKTTCR